MDRCKLEYMIRNLSSDAREEILDIIDPKGEYHFHSLARDFLMNPDTKNVWILSFIPANYKPENIENTKLLYSLYFKRINEIMIENKHFPIFENPENLTASELTRRDILKKQSERYLNELFNTDSYYSYNPPIYNPENHNQNK